MFLLIANYKYISDLFLPKAQQPLMGQGLFVISSSELYSETSQ